MFVYKPEHKDILNLWSNEDCTLQQKWVIKFFKSIATDDASIGQQERIIN